MWAKKDLPIEDKDPPVRVECKKCLNFRLYEEIDFECEYCEEENMQNSGFIPVSPGIHRWVKNVDQIDECIAPATNQGNSEMKINSGNNVSILGQCINSLRQVFSNAG